MNGQPVLVVEDLSRSFGGLRALNDLFLTTCLGEDCGPDWTKLARGQDDQSVSIA